MHYIFIGSTGNVGSSLLREFDKAGMSYSTLTRREIEDDTFEWVPRATALSTSCVIVNCVAFMSVDLCQQNQKTSELVNLVFAQNLALKLKNSANAKLVHLSTDFVFSGMNRSTPYTNDEKTNPINVYGVHKADSEKVVREILGNRVRVIRISSFVGRSARATTFLDKIEMAIKRKENIEIVDDLTISISTAGLLASQIARCFQSDQQIQHAVHSGQTSWFELAQEYARINSIDFSLFPISVDSLQLPAPRPRYSVLSPSPVFSGSINTNWKDGLRSTYSDMT
jgi:dTDP-4-dehydrorhamnose reductase